MVRSWLVFSCLVVTAGVSRADDPWEVGDVTRALDELQVALDGDQTASTLGVVTGLEALQQHAKRKALDDRFRKLTVAAAKRASPRATAIVADGGRTATIHANALPLIREALEACRQWSTPNDEAEQRYVRKLERAKAIDPGSPRFAGRDGSAVVDIAMAFVDCELSHAVANLDADDRYEPARGVGKPYVGCGSERVTLRAVKIGKQWQAWEWNDGDDREQIACSKIPKQSTADTAFTAGIEDWKDGDVLVTSGKPWMKEHPIEGTTKTQTYRYQEVAWYSPKMTIWESPCGEKDKKVACDAKDGPGQGTAFAYNAAAHFVARATTHKTAGRVARCTDLLAQANRVARDWASREASGDFTRGLRYKVRTGAILDEKAAVAAIKAHVVETERLQDTGWCKR